MLLDVLRENPGGKQSFIQFVCDSCQSECLRIYRKALGCLAECSWTALGGLWSRKKLAWKPLGGCRQAIWAMLDATWQKKRRNDAATTLGPAECAGLL